MANEDMVYVEKKDIYTYTDTVKPQYDSFYAAKSKVILMTGFVTTFLSHLDLILAFCLDASCP